MNFFGIEHVNAVFRDGAGRPATLIDDNACVNNANRKGGVHMTGISRIEVVGTEHFHTVQLSSKPKTGFCFFEHESF